MRFNSRRTVRAPPRTATIEPRGHSGADYLVGSTLAALTLAGLATAVAPPLAPAFFLGALTVGVTVGSWAGRSTERRLHDEARTHPGPRAVNYRVSTWLPVGLKLDSYQTSTGQPRLTTCLVSVRPSAHSTVTV